MTPSDFLKAIWPDSGIYALATPYTPPNSTQRVYAHKTFDAIEAALEFVNRVRAVNDVYFCVHSLKEHKVWNPQKINAKTGELGAYEVRTQANTQEARSFFFDLDVGKSKPGQTKYPAQPEALVGLIQFCKETGLPKPLVTSSGGGLHVYWRVATPLPSEEWRQHASKLRQLAQHYGLLADPARTTDTASVLRVAGTYNFKDRENPRPVKVLVEGAPPLGTGQFLKLVNDAVVRAGITPKVLPNLGQMDKIAAMLGSNTQDEFTGPPVTLRALVTACAQMQRLVMLKGNVSEPEWYHTINLVRFVENGEKLVHKVSEGHPDYDPAATDRKVAQLREKAIRPTSCQKLAEVCGDQACEACPFAGRVKSPIVAAKYKDVAPAPVVTQMVGQITVSTEVPPPPYPFARMKDGKITKTTTNSQGDEIISDIYEHDLYPVRRIVNFQSEIEQQVWRVMLPRQGAKDFVLDADALYDRRKFVTSIANHGIYPKHSCVQDLQDYMIAYIAELQRLADAEAQCNHLGWSDDYNRFIMPDKILADDGTAKPAQLSVGAARATQHVARKGMLVRQVELLRFYDHPGYLANQFFIMCGLAAPLFYMTGHHGVIVNASGPAGASKSSSLYAAASFWGNPKLLPINGTNNGATIRGRNERVTTLANLPICVDEITHMPQKDAVDLAMGVTQPGHRIRLDTSGVERASGGGYKATIMLTTANKSLHSVLAENSGAGTAGSMRVLEIQFNPTLVHRKYEADEFLHELNENYGHLGEQFMGWVIKNRLAVEVRVRAKMREIDEKARIQSSERFWSAAIACAIVAAEIARELGLTYYDPAAIEAWCLDRLIPMNRGVVISEYSSPIHVLANYLEKINGDILILTKSGAANQAFPLRAPRGQMLAHYDQGERIMWVLRKEFRDYCLKEGEDFNRVLEELHAARILADGTSSRVVPVKDVKKVLGAGTEYAKAQSRCFVINMSDPEVTGAVDLKVEVNPSVSTTPATGSLRVV